MYHREDWTLFRNLATLGQKAGVPSEKIPALVAKELTDNALDLGATCRVGLLVENGFWVEDDGEGIDGTDTEIADLFSIGRPLRSSKLLRRPTRGALGNGLRVVAGAVLSTGGSLEVQTKRRLLRLAPRDDGSTLVERAGRSCASGTRIEAILGASLPVDIDTLDWAEQAIALAAGGSSYQGKTSPHWYDTDAFFELLQSAGERTVREVIEEFDGCSGAKAGTISAAYRMRPARELDREEADRLLATARQHARIVKPARLGYLGPVVKGWPASYAKIEGTYHTKAARGQQHAEIPFVLEAFVGIATEADLLVTVNRTPITANVEAFHQKDTLWITGCGLEKDFTVGRRAIRICLNIQTPHMPITSDGKAPDLQPFAADIELVLGRAVSRARRSVAGDRAGRRLTTKDVILDRLHESVDKASDSGAYRFSLRQLFYVVRPHVLEACETEPEYDYFAKVITDYEAEHGEIEGMYRDPRGTLYHPHTREEIPVGTLQAEQYERPPWTFNKVLYCEKEGIFPILKAARWPERHDCALMTSKGFASRAARDLLDLMGESDEVLRVFCIHDADASGTMIYQALQEGTRARPGRKIRIVNLGLEPEEALEMGLQVEKVKRDSSRRQPVANYVDEEWHGWLQNNRVELNAMTTPQLLEWLDRKFEEYGGKLLPPESVLTDRLELEMRTSLEAQITEQVLREARIQERVRHEVRRRRQAIKSHLVTIEQNVRDDLEAHPERHWSHPVREIAETIAGTVTCDPGTVRRARS
jgi:hypothetical protein